MIELNTKMPDCMKDYNTDTDISNSLGYRSDEFVNVDGQDSLLFAGCSNSFGAGIEKHQDTWTHLVYKEINPSSGYFNVSSPGASPSGVISRIFRYIANYGMPKTIFILLPSLSRSIAPGQGVLYEEWRDEFASPVMENFIHFHEQYAMLSHMCYLHGTRLISTTYDMPRSTSLLLSLDEKYFFDMYYEGWKERLMEINLSGLELLADDGDHWGTAWHRLAAEIFLDQYSNNSV